MSIYSAILDPAADGCLHLPLPPELRHGKVWIEARLEAAEKSPIAPLATSEMIEQRIAAFAALRAMGGLRQIIPDPVAWQREQRADRPLPGGE